MVFKSDYKMPSDPQWDIESILCLAVTPDQKYLMVSYENGTISQWDISGIDRDVEIAVRVCLG
jgi:hypothetical protein